MIKHITPCAKPFPLPSTQQIAECMYAKVVSPAPVSSRSASVFQLACLWLSTCHFTGCWLLHTRHMQEATPPPPTAVLRGGWLLIPMGFCCEWRMSWTWSGFCQDGVLLTVLVTGCWFRNTAAISVFMTGVVTSTSCYRHQSKSKTQLPVTASPHRSKDSTPPAALV